MMLERLHVCVLPVILVVFYYVVPVWSPVLDGYVSTCPTPSEIKERSLHHTCPKNKPYHIVRDPQRNKYKYGCFESRLVPAGNMTTLDISGNINADDCQEGTFQPLPYRSNTQCACKETKGHCNKTGQVVASNGSITEDRTCRCDFRRGYKISTTPSNECFCNSSSEDCTCIKEECKMGYRLSPDYECVHENLYSTTNYTCEDITSDDSITESVPGSDTSVSEESTTEYVPGSDTSVSEESTTEYVPGSDTSVSEESTTESVPDNDTFIPERMPTDKQLPWYMIAIIVVVVVVCVLGAFIFGKKKMIKIISCICAPMRICCKKCRPGRNGSAATDNEDIECLPVQATGTSKGKDSVPVQEKGSDRANEKLIKVDKPSTEDTVLDYIVE